MERGRGRGRRGGGYGGQRGRGGRGGDDHRRGRYNDGGDQRDRYEYHVEQPRASSGNNAGGGDRGIGQPRAPTWTEGGGDRRENREDQPRAPRWAEVAGDRRENREDQPRAPRWAEVAGDRRENREDQPRAPRWAEGGGDRRENREDQPRAPRWTEVVGDRRENREDQPRAPRWAEVGGDRRENREDQPGAPRWAEVGGDRRDPVEQSWAPQRRPGGEGAARGNQKMEQPKQFDLTSANKASSSDSHGSGMQISKDAKQLSPVQRPDKGGSRFVRSVKLRTNHFLVKYNADTVIMHYDVDVKPETPPKHGRPVRIPKSDLSMIRDKLFSDNPSQFPLSSTAYDGEKNIFSAVPLPTGKFKVEVSKGEDTKVCSYIFNIKLVSELKLGKLTEYLRGCATSIPRDILQGMDLVMKENPSREMISVGRNFYPKVPDLEDDLGHGISAFKGFQHSLKPTSQGLSLCLDYSVLAFRKRLPVLEFLKQHIDGFNLNDFGRFRRDVYNALEGLKVYVNHRKTSQKFVVKGLTDKNARDYSFTIEDPDGEIPPRKVLLVDYFREKYDKKIVHANLPCLELGKPNKKNDVPMEFCEIVEGQRFHKENLDRDAAQSFKTLSLPFPRNREGMIHNMIQSRTGPCGGGIAKSFGIEVNMNMTPVEGRVIGPPELKLGAPNGKVVTIAVDREKCQWNLVGKLVVQGKPIDRWAVLDFRQNDRGYSRGDLDPDVFIPKLIARCDKLGIRIAEPLFYEPTSMRKFSNVNMLGELLEGLSEQACRRSGGRLQLLVCVMARRDPGYKYLKWICETKIGIVTQCCLSFPANKASDQYLANLALKINAKLGGSNVELSQLPISAGAGHVMFVGADVNHPAARNETSPSIAAVVGTLNWPAANRYAARVRAQYHRCEKILNFGDMCVELVLSYVRQNKVRPERLIIFRDGVSEGQFDMVLNEELLDLKRALETINYSPTITLIVAQKRHQTRFFPQTREDGSSTGNVPPGTVVDTRIIHPFEFDFYLCSHYGSLGTSKPTHYHVLYDEHGFNSDQLQKLIYDMCFTMARCTKPVSLVPPVYYADLVAYRGRLYHEAVIDGQSPPSARPSSSSLPGSSSSTALIDESFFKLHANLENEMFFI